MAAVERSVHVAGQAVAVDTELSVVDVGLRHGGVGAVVPPVTVPLGRVRNVQRPEAWRLAVVQLQKGQSAVRVGLLLALSCSCWTVGFKLFVLDCCWL